LNSHYTYFIILAASAAGPLALSFDRKVGFYKKWKFLLLPVLIPALLYIIWDIYFVSKAVWSFNDKYTTGWHLFNLPVEEVLFFFVVPYCCLFIYECIRCYFPGLRDKKQADRILQLLAIVLLITGIYFNNLYYTGWTFILTALFIAVLFLFRKFFKAFDAVSFFVSYCIILVPFLIVNGLLTAIPVVIYNNAENLGIRIYTIPFEDVFYGMLLVLMNIAIYEKQVKR
jgi:lycopene cyclase domain-containing protein